MLLGLSRRLSPRDRQKCGNIEGLQCRKTATGTIKIVTNTACDYIQRVGLFAFKPRMSKMWHMTLNATRIVTIPPGRFATVTTNDRLATTVQGVKCRKQFNEDF